MGPISSQSVVYSASRWAEAGGHGPRILLVGGTFDPPHRAHVIVAERARAWWDRLEGQGDADAGAHVEQGSPDGGATGTARLVFVPAARSPHKREGPRASDGDRLDMLRAALAGVAEAEVSTIELDRGRVGAGEASYWIDTVREFVSAHAGARVRFLIGADQAVAFHRWREPKEILSLARPIVAPREPWITPRQLRESLEGTTAWTSQEIGAWMASMLPMPVERGRATDIRGAIMGRALRDPALEDLDPAVRAIIEARGLYRGSTAEDAPRSHDGSRREGE